ncbi:hypothetical protein [Mesorhizobium sp. B2-1-3A]|uniref:hypothetical protein n=1 Tax=Mesorhizobium sp. B2-1-3A TaxID=2589971 RepID=UPI0015E28DD5|nr:hypothetical protein [Mesorhizobium sp. B2-1-3A]
MTIISVLTMIYCFAIFIRAKGHNQLVNAKLDTSGATHMAQNWNNVTSEPQKRRFSLTASVVATTISDCAARGSAGKQGQTLPGRGEHGRADLIDKGEALWWCGAPCLARIADARPSPAPGALHAHTTQLRNGLEGPSHGR